MNPALCTPVSWTSECWVCMFNMCPHKGCKQTWMWSLRDHPSVLEKAHAAPLAATCQVADNKIILIWDAALGDSWKTNKQTNKRDSTIARINVGCCFCDKAVLVIWLGWDAKTTWLGLTKIVLANEKEKKGSRCPEVLSKTSFFCHFNRGLKLSCGPLKKKTPRGCHAHNCWHVTSRTCNVEWHVLQTCQCGT